ncbi:MAG: hypothetical protein M5R36_02265 [Deltaproteobacteria bacterium]|nr:hypothetical protein [Deltaproteobacteria bacterium]
MILASATASWGLDPAELQAFLEVGMTDEVVQLCNENASEVASSPTLKSLCAKAQGGGAPAAPEPAPTPEPDVPGVPSYDDTSFSAPSTPSAPAPSAPVPSTPAAPSSTPAAFSAPVGGLDPAAMAAQLSAGQAQAVVNLCDTSEAQISSHPQRGEIMKLCGQARMRAYSTGSGGGTTALTGAMGDLEASLKAGYDKVASFDLGKTRMLSLDTIPADAEKSEMEKKAVREMWDAIVMRHAEEGFPEAVSDQIIVWTVGIPGDPNNPGFVNMVMDRIIKDEGDRGRQRWLGARLRMLTDRFTNIDPNKGENATRQGNLEALKLWMTELLELTYFDNNVLVGMYRYKGNRAGEQYDPTNPGSEDLFHKALFFYDEGRKRASSHKAKAVMDLDIAFLCSRYRSDNTMKLVEFYKKGFLHARRGLRLMQVVNKVTPEVGKSFYRYEKDNPDVAARLQKAYGDTLVGWIYNLYLNKDYLGVVAQKKYTLDAGFDWENKADVLLLFAESAKLLAADSLQNEVRYRRYKSMCLAAGSRAVQIRLASARRKKCRRRTTRRSAACSTRTGIT